MATNLEDEKVNSVLAAVGTPSVTGICNQALGRLGRNLITDITDTSKEGILCRSHYSELRDAVLEEGRWTFAKRLYAVDVASRLENPPNGWRYKYAYPIPDGILITLRIFEDIHSPYQMDWEKFGRFIHTDAEQLFMEVFVRVVDPREFTSTFRQALVYRLARDLALPLTQNDKLFEQMAVMYDRAIDKALAIDGMQGVAETIPPGSLVRARTGGVVRG